jgi:hypothetical protein
VVTGGGLDAAAGSAQQIRALGERREGEGKKGKREGTPGV